MQSGAFRAALRALAAAIQTSFALGTPRTVGYQTALRPASLLEGYRWPTGSAFLNFPSPYALVADGSSLLPPCLPH